ncbi:hypothetical protein HY487_01380 [Candidatus Woesearchaeota archaeon]|nr:hypothetical protein [Candidatus Woesearchaeota archaeon]
MDELKLDILVGRLETEEGRTRALIQAVKKGLVKSPDYYEKTIQGSIKLRMPTEAIALAKQRGDDAAVFRIHGENGLFNSGVEYAHQRGYFAAEIELLEQQEAEARKGILGIGDTIINENYHARREAISLMKQKKYREAGELLEQIGDNADAGRAFSMAGNDQKAIVNYEIAKWHRHAGDVSMRVKDFKRARVNYEKHGMWELAAQASARLGDVENERTYRELANLLRGRHQTTPILTFFRNKLNFFGRSIYSPK